jgi:methyl-accepting chemotaxis protein
MIHSTVDALEQIARPFEHETQMVSQQVERMYKGFQYQDRISQMMTLLHEDIERLQQVMVDPKADIDAVAWLARLQSQYVMAEQHEHHDHTGNSVSSAGEYEDTTFF